VIFRAKNVGLISTVPLTQVGRCIFTSRP